MTRPVAEMKLILVAIILCGVYGLSSSQDCTPRTLNKCLALLDMDQLPALIIPDYPKDTILKNCDQYSLFSKCMSLYVIKYCTVELQFAIEGLDSAYAFLCRDGLDDYIRYQPCFAHDDVQKGASYCNSSLNARLTDLRRQQIASSKYVAARTCQFVNDYIDCESNLLKSFCSNGAASWQRTFVSSLWRPLLAGNCQDWNTLPSTNTLEHTTKKPTSPMPVEWVIIMSLAIAICGILIVIGVIFLTVLKLRRARSDSRHSWRSQSIDMPPPYPGPFILYPSEEDPTEQAVFGDTSEIQAFKPPSYQSSLVSIPFETGFQNDAYLPLNDDDSLVVQRMGGGVYDDDLDEGGCTAGIAIGAVGGSPVPTAHFSQPSPFHCNDSAAAASGASDADRFPSQRSDYY